MPSEQARVEQLQREFNKIIYYKLLSESEITYTMDELRKTDPLTHIKKFQENILNPTHIGEYVLNKDGIHDRTTDKNPLEIIGPIPFSIHLETDLINLRAENRTGGYVLSPNGIGFITVERMASTGKRSQKYFQARTQEKNIRTLANSNPESNDWFMRLDNKNGIITGSINIGMESGTVIIRPVHETGYNAQTKQLWTAIYNNLMLGR